MHTKMLVPPASQPAGALGSSPSAIGHCSYVYTPPIPDYEKD